MYESKESEAKALADANTCIETLYTITSNRSDDMRKSVLRGVLLIKKTREDVINGQNTNDMLFLIHVAVIVYLLRLYEEVWSPLLQEAGTSIVKLKARLFAAFVKYINTDTYKYRSIESGTLISAGTTINSVVTGVAVKLMAPSSTIQPTTLYIISEYNRIKKLMQTMKETTTLS
jgi:hypothetical protein